MNPVDNPILDDREMLYDAGHRPRFRFVGIVNMLKYLCSFPD
jgi:hypothetical protein